MAHSDLPSSQLTRTCPVCDSEDCDVYLEGENPDLTIDSIGQSRTHQDPGTVLRCTRCGLGFRESRPDPTDLAELYERQDVATYLGEVPGRRLTARRHWEFVRPLMQRGHLLDIGAGAGFFLEQVVNAGWKATGIEPSPAMCRYAEKRLGHRAELECGALESSALTPSSFDVVTLWDVLEHAPNPRDFLRASAGLLKHGGYLLLNVPDLDSRVSRILGRRWPLLLPEHLSYFTRDSLLRCGESAGLTCERFDRRPAFFSLGRVFKRLGERDVPFAGRLENLFERFGADRWVVPVPLGEILGVFRKPAP